MNKTLNETYAPVVEFRSRNIGTKIFLFGKGHAYALNETGYFIWDSLDGLTDLEEVVALVTEKYNCSGEEAKEGVEEFIQFLLGINAIEKIG